MADNSAMIAALTAQMAELQKALAALAAPPAPVAAPVVAPVVIAPPAPVHATAPGSFVDSQGVEWIAEGIKRWNYGIDQSTLAPPVPLPAPGHNGWWSSGDPYRVQQRDPAFLNAEMQRIRNEWAASRPPAPAPKIYPPGSRG